MPQKFVLYRNAGGLFCTEPAESRLPVRFRAPPPRPDPSPPSESLAARIEPPSPDPIRVSLRPSEPTPRGPPQTDIPSAPSQAGHLAALVRVTLRRLHPSLSQPQPSLPLSESLSDPIRVTLRSTDMYPGGLRRPRDLPVRNLPGISGRAPSGTSLRSGDTPEDRRRISPGISPTDISGDPLPAAEESPRPAPLTDAGVLHGPPSATRSPHLIIKGTEN